MKERLCDKGHKQIRRDSPTGEVSIWICPTCNPHGILKSEKELVRKYDKDKE